MSEETAAAAAAELATLAASLSLRRLIRQARLSGTSHGWVAGGLEMASDRLPKPDLSDYSIS